MGARPIPRCKPVSTPAWKISIARAETAFQWCGAAMESMTALIALMRSTAR